MSEKFVFSPKGKFTITDNEAANKRTELRERLPRREEIVANPNGQLEDAKDKKPGEKKVEIPKGILAISLGLNQKNIETYTDEIKIPSGCLEPSFYWFERDQALLSAEIEAMKKYFPEFKLNKLEDGRLCWNGYINPKNIRKNAEWLILLVYEDYHPNNTTYGGSIKVYSIKPDLEQISRGKGHIPHTIRDSNNHLYLDLARVEDAGKTSTSAASTLGRVYKWIIFFELWMRE